jgi:hypothetical protein
MDAGVIKLRVIFFSMVGVLFLLTTASGYLYHQNRNYENQNQRLIILNDSILSENIELKNELHQKPSAALQPFTTNVKTGKRK